MDYKDLTAAEKHALLDGKLAEELTQDRNNVTRRIDMNQALQQFANIVSKTTETSTITVDEKDINRASKAAQEVNEINRATRESSEPEWRNELDNLHRQLFGADTESLAKQKADEVTKQHDRIIAEIENNISYHRKMLKTPYLSLHRGFNPDGEPLVTPKGQRCGCDGCAILIKVQRYVDALPDAKKQRERAIRIAGSAVQSAKARDLLRPRWRELFERAATIDAARSKNGRPDVRFEEEAITNSDRHRQKVRHGSQYLWWEK